MTQAYGKGAFETVDRLESSDDASYKTSSRALLHKFRLDYYSLPEFSMFGNRERALPPAQVPDLAWIPKENEASAVQPGCGQTILLGPQVLRSVTGYDCIETNRPWSKTSPNVTWAQVPGKTLDAFLVLFARGAIQGEEDWSTLDMGPRWEIPCKVAKQLLTAARISGVLRELLDVVRRSGIGAERFSVTQVLQFRMPHACTLQRLAAASCAANLLLYAWQ